MEKSKYPLLKKAYMVYHTDDRFALNMPWTYTELVHLEPTESVNRAKSKAVNSFECAYTSLRVRRKKESDLFLFEEQAMPVGLINYNLQYRKWKNDMEELVKTNNGKKVYIYSGQWGAYWKDNRSGYTYDIQKAGIYDIEDAWDATSHCGLEKRISFKIVN